MTTNNALSPMTLQQAKFWFIDLKDMWISPGIEAPRARNSTEVDSVLFQAAPPMPAKEALDEIAQIEDQWLFVPNTTRQIKVQSDTRLWLMGETRQLPLNENHITGRPESWISLHSKADELERHPDLNKGWAPESNLSNLVKIRFKESERGQALMLHHKLLQRHLTSHFQDNR